MSRLAHTSLPPFTELAPDEAKTMRIVIGSKEPVGARLVARELRKLDVVLSEATISRMFVKLDAMGYTEPIGRKGRIATAEGRSLAEFALRNESANAQLKQALDIRELDQLIDLLRARRGVERESAALAAERATATDLAALRENVEQYSAAVKRVGEASALGNDFHRLLLKAAHSPLLETMYGIALDDRLEALEPVLLVITSGHGSVIAAPPEHMGILEAIERRDAQKAQEILDNHLTRLISEVEEFADLGDRVMLTRLFELVR